MFAHLWSCCHKHLWNTVRRQQPSLITTHDAWTAAGATHRAKQMLWALLVLVEHLWVPFSRRSCLVRVLIATGAWRAAGIHSFVAEPSPVTFLLKEWPGYAKDRDSAVFLEDSSQKFAKEILCISLRHQVSRQDNLCILEIQLHSASTVVILFFVLHSLSFECASMNSGVSLRSRKLKELLGHCP